MNNSQHPTPAATLNDISILRDYLTQPHLVYPHYGDDTPHQVNLDQQLHVAVTWGPVNDPPATATILCQAMSALDPDNDTRRLYRASIDLVNTSDPGVLVIAVTILQVALNQPDADLVLWQDLSPDDPVAIRASAAACAATAKAISDRLHIPVSHVPQLLEDSVDTLTQAAETHQDETHGDEVDR